MSDQFIKLASPATGSFEALSKRDISELAAAGGKSGPADGKIVPPPPSRTKPEIEQITERLNMATSSISRDLRFEVDLDSGRSIIQVLDRETGELIRQIPPEKVSTYEQSGGDIAIRLYDELV